MSESQSVRSADMWLLLLTEGGLWSAAEIGKRLGVDATEAANTLKGMAEWGSVRKWPRSETNDRVRFSVTRECTVPRGVKVADLAGVMA